jgi:hypothetical protein
VTLRAFGVLVVAFAFSVALRSPNLGRPLAGHHEFCTALTLIILENWNVDGLAEHYGASAVNFGSAADANIPWMTMGEAERDGRTYYLSHPPLAYYLPYAVFRVLGVAASPMALQVFALFFHFTTMLCIYFLMRYVVNDGPLSWSPLLAALFYCFMPSPLWFHSNAYMADIFVVSMWAFHLVSAYHCLVRGEKAGGWAWMAYAFTLAATVFTSWLGVWAAVANVGLIHFMDRPPHFKRHALFVTVVAVVVPLLVTAWIYGSAVGLDAFITYLKGRSGFRSTLRAGDLGLWPYVRQVFENYRTAALPVLMLLLVSLALLAQRQGRAMLPPLLGFAVLTTVPVLLELVFFLEYAGHDFVALKGCVFLCGLAAVILEAALLGVRRPAGMRAAVLGVTCLAGALYYVRQNPYPDEAATGPGSAIHLGDEVSHRVKPDEVLFTFGTAWEPQTVWYAGRTPMRIRSVEEGAAFLQRYGHDSGMIYRPNDSGGTWERITPDGRTQGLPERNR